MVWQHCAETFYDNTGGATVTYNVGGEASQWQWGGPVGDRYTVQTNPGASFSLAAGDAMNPTLSATGTVADGQWGGLSGTLIYTAAAYPVNASISLTGTTTDSSGNLDILIGQHCSASLSVTGMPQGFTVTGWQWSVTGPTFQTWSADTPAVNGNLYNPDASYYVDGAGPMTIANPGWYWHEIGNDTSKAETVSARRP